MKVLFQIRPGYKSGDAGDSVQMLKTMTYLKEAGVDVRVSANQNINLKDFDIIHIFNCTRVAEAHGFYKNAARQGKKIVVSPMFIDMHDYYAKNPARLAAWRSENVLRRELLQGCHMILPNTNKELECIRNILLVDAPARVVYLGVDGFFSDASAEWFQTNYKLKDFILCVGRLSPIKNQLSLIRAVKDIGLPIVLIGSVNNGAYAVKCAEEAGGYIKYIPHLRQEDLASAYKAAKVHVQPSWFETVGLTSLEAAAAGTRVVITKNGGAKEYFGDMVHYVDPGDLDSIRQGVLSALENQDISALQQHIRENYTWAKAAQATLDAYNHVLSEDYDPSGKNTFYSQSYNV